jgi:hypothetical protein
VLSALMFLLPAAVANAGDLLILSDTASTDSTLLDGTPRTVNLYVVHAEQSGGATGVDFAVAGASGFTGVWLSETSSYLTFGTSTTGIAVAYGGCLSEPVLVLTLTYQLFGTSAACSELRIVASSGRPFPLCLEGGGCFFETPCHAGALHVNCSVATEQTTWGRVKALYR